MMRAPRPGPWWLALATAVGTWLWADRAGACELAGLDIPRAEFPAEGATDIPTNALLWLADHHEGQGDTLILRAPDGTEIPLLTTKARGGGFLFLVMRPTEELSPNTTYEVSSCSLGYCGRALRTFTTGDGPDLDPPARPEEIGRERGHEYFAFCGGRFDWVKVHLDFEGLLVLDLDVPEFDEKTLNGRPDWLATDPDEPIVFGDLGLGFGSPIHGRMATFDQAGNFSEWVELDPIEVGCGCASGRPVWASVGGWLLVILAAFARRRRGSGRGIA